MKEIIAHCDMSFIPVLNDNVISTILAPKDCDIQPMSHYCVSDGRLVQRGSLAGKL